MVLDPDGRGRATYTEYDENGEPIGEPEVTIIERRDPDHSDGSGWVPHWMEQTPKTLADKVAEIGPGGLPAAPDHATQGTGNYGEPIIS